jgi:hypothetical protein
MWIEWLSGLFLLVVLSAIGLFIFSLNEGTRLKIEDMQRRGEVFAALLAERPVKAKRRGRARRAS